MASTKIQLRECQNARLVLEFLFKLYVDNKFKKEIIENFKKNQNLAGQQKKEQFVSISQEGEIWKISGKYYDIKAEKLIDGFNYGVLYNFMNKEYRERIQLPSRKGSAKNDEAKIEGIREGFQWLQSKEIIEDKQKVKSSKTRLFEGLSDIKGDNLSFVDVMKRLDDVFGPHSKLLNIAERVVESASDPEPNTSPNEQDAYLILLIETSLFSTSNNKNYKMLAWFDNSIKTEQLGQENEIPEINTRQILGRWVGQSQQRKAENQKLLIEIYVSEDLLNENYEHWTYLCEGLLPEQLREKYLVYIRWQKRWSLAKKFKYQSIWQDRWNRFRNSQMLHPHTDLDWEHHIREQNNLWFNASQIGSSMKDYVKKFTMHGMPIALWSRCRDIDHWVEVNSLVERSNSSQLPINIFNLRQGAPTIIPENSTELGHHLTLMWEDPHRCPPWEDAEPFDDKSSAFSY